MNLIGYIRVSTAKQVQEGFGLEAQRHRLKEWCDKTGHCLVDVFEDAGVSASTIDGRPALLTALQKLENKYSDGLVVVKLDRLIRNIVHLPVIWKYFVDPNGFQKKLISTVETLDTKTANGRFVLAMMVCMASYEREIVDERLEQVRDMRRSKSLPIGRTPFGKIRISKDVYVDNPAEVEAARVAMQLHVSGMGLRKIGKQLEERGLRPKMGGKWHPATVSKLLPKIEEITDDN